MVINMKRTEEERMAKEYALKKGIVIPKIRLFESQESFEKRRTFFYMYLLKVIKIEENIKEVELSSKQYLEEIGIISNAISIDVIDFKKVPEITYKGSIAKVLRKLEKIYNIQKIQEISFMEFLEEEKKKRRMEIIERAMREMPKGAEIIVLETTTNLQGENEFEKAVDEMDSTGEMVSVITSGECFEKLAFNPMLANLQGILEVWNADPKKVRIRYK